MYGHAVSEKRVQAIVDRATFSKDMYLISPGKVPFRELVRIVIYATAFLSKLMKKSLGRDLRSCQLGNKKKLVSAFSSLMGEGIVSPLPNVATVNECIEVDMTELWDMFKPTDLMIDEEGRTPSGLIFNMVHQTESRLTDKFISMALVHLYTVASKEVRKFNSKEWLSKVAVEHDGILYARNRLHDGLSFISAGELSNISLGDLGINISAPMIDRYSELAYSIVNHMHYVVGGHKGVETLHRMTLQHVHIVQAMSLHREIAGDCITCRKKQKRFVEVEMGPQSQASLTLAPPFFTVMLDLMGPFMVYVPGYEAKTRNRKTLEGKVWVAVFCCPATRNVNLQVIEKSDAGGILDAVTRLCCETGVPKFVICDKQSSIERMLRESRIEVRNVQDQLTVEFGINFRTCPVGGHNFNGQVERCIRSIRESLVVSGADKKILHATGLQTVMKLIENRLNNIPLGYAFGRDSDNSAALRILTPAMLRHGRNSERCLNGPIKLTGTVGKMMEKVEDTYRAWFKVWRDAWIPKLMRAPKWHDNSVDLECGDLVYFKRTATELGHNEDGWVVGKVDEVERDADRRIRRLWIKYKNFNDEKFQTTERSVRSVVKLFSLEDASIQEDLAEVQRYMKDVLGQEFVDERNVLDDGGVGDRPCRVSMVRAVLLMATQWTYVTTWLNMEIWSLVCSGTTWRNLITMACWRMTYATVLRMQ